MSPRMGRGQMGSGTHDCVTRPTIALNTSNGEFVLYNSAGTVNVTVDVEGFFIGGSGNLYAPVSPSQRVCDTRTGNPSGLSSPYNQCNGDTIAAAGTLTVQVAGLAGVPSTAASVVVSITSLNETATGRLVAYQAGTSLPSVSTLNFTSGAKVNNEATIAVGTNGDIDIYNSAGTTDVLVDVLGYYGSNYTYNGDGLRMTKTINGTVSTFTYDTTQTNPLVLEDGANAYVYGPSGEPVEQVSTSGTPLYFVSDQLGSTRTLTNSSGTVVAQYTYGPLGSIATKTGSASTPIGFAGAYTDSETGFLYLLHRYYDPTTGEFLTVDPDVASTKQPYTYAGDDPVNATDPSGEKTIGVCIDAYAISAVFGHGSLGFISGCLVWNYATAVAVTVTEGQGDSNGLDGGGDITVGVQSSTAGNPYDLAGPFNFSYRSVGAVAVGASVNIFWNSDGTVKGLQAEGGVGPDVGYAQGNGTSDTQVFPIAFIRGIGDSGQIVAAVADHSLITSVVDEALQNAGQAPISLSRAVGLIADGSVYWCGS